MPCDTIQIMTVQEELKGLNKGLLKKALIAMGFSVNDRTSSLEFFGTHKGTEYTGSYANDKFTASSYAGQLDINAVKVAYSTQVVESTAMDFGWSLTNLGNGEYEAEKAF